LARSRRPRRLAAAPAPLAERAAAPAVTVPGAAPTAPESFPPLPRVSEGVEYGLLGDLAPAQQLFSFAAAAVPPAADVHVAWGAWLSGERRLVGALLLEREGASAMLYGPVVVTTVDGERGVASLDVAAQLVAGAIEESAARGVQTLFARPQGLDRIWIRHGFIPVPEGALPSALRRGTAAGLFAYRGGSALWTFRETSSGARVAR